MIGPRVARNLLTASLGAIAVASSAAPARAQDSWTTPFPGVRRLFRKTAKPLRIHALLVDLCTPGVGIRATKNSERGKTPSSFGASVGAEAAVNGDFFQTDGSYKTSGLAMGEGAVWPGSKDNASEGFFAFGPNFASFSPPPGVVTAPEEATQIVGGRPRLLEAGVFPASFKCVSHYCNKEPRTGAGFSSDRRTLFLVVVDGRSAQSVGVTMPELGAIFADLGAYNAMSLDGGGSSAMWVKGKGVVSAPSDGFERAVANHIAVQSDGVTKGSPMACVESPLEELGASAHALDGLESTDVDGDGLADLCGRGATGFQCHPSTGSSFGEALVIDELSDDAGFDDVVNWGTIRMGDIDDDGRDDVCARTDTGVRCWRSEGNAFGAAIEGPELSDAKGWDQPRFALTMRLADIDRDGKSDLCAHAAEGFQCWPSLGDGFGPAIVLPDLSDKAGFDEPSRWGSIRMGDIDADGRDDVCARTAEGMQCWRSIAGGFSEAITGPAWSDADGWTSLSTWSTIRLADIDGDGRADLCGRGHDGFRCHASTGDGFGPAIDGPALTDDSGWGDQANFLTLRVADTDGDGSSDVCGRANAGLRCWKSTGKGFSQEIIGPELSDAKSWYAHKYFRTIGFADIDGDGSSDVCARAAKGMLCWRSDGAGFPTLVDGPEWSNDAGWDALPYYGTIRIGTPPPRASNTTGSGGSGAGAGGESAATGLVGAAGDEGNVDGGCACRAGREPEGWRAPWLLAAAAAAFGAARRRRR